MDVDGEENLGNCLSSFVDNGSTESHRYYSARRTLLEMLRDRGYAVPNSEIELSLQEFRDRHGQTPDIDALRISALHRDDPSLKTLVLFCAPNIVKVNVIRAIVTEIINRDSLYRLILVVQNKITSQALKAVELISCKVEIFQFPRMSQKDAIARYYGLEKGQVVKVTYNGELTQLHVTYRCVW